MKEKLNVGVLVTARNVYMEYLKKKLSPLLLEGIITVYKEAIETQNNLGSYKYNKQFQIYLNQIPDWNQTILVNETKRIIDEINYLQKLVAAIFMSEVRILTSIRLAGDNSVFQIRIPKSDILIHKIYINIAKTIYSSIDLLDKFKDIEKSRKNYDEVKTIIEYTIEDTITNELIPIKNILEEYLSDTILTDISREPVDNEQNDNEQNDNDEIIENIDNMFEENNLTNKFGSVSEQLGSVSENLETMEPEPETITIDLSKNGSGSGSGSGKSEGSFFSNLFGSEQTTEQTEQTEQPVIEDPEQSSEQQPELEQSSFFGSEKEPELESQPVVIEEQMPSENMSSENSFGSSSNSNTEYSIPDIDSSVQSFF